jgi:acetoin utilization protein AcuB
MKISDVMTPCPYLLSAETKVDEALETMAIRGIRHLPVVKEGQLVGVLTERDAKLSQLMSEGSQIPLEAGAICSKNPYVVQSEDEVAQVAYDMAEGKTDCALVADPDGNFVGIFTSTDACRLIYMLLDTSK